MLNLRGRPAKIGNSVNVRAQAAGDADVMAIDLPLTFAISEEEFDALIGPGAHDAFYVQPGTGPVEPRFRGVGFTLEKKLEGVTVTLSVGLTPDRHTLHDAKLAKVHLTPMVGGMTECVLTVQALPSPEAMGAVTAHLNGEVELDLEGGRLVDGKPKSKGRKKATEPDAAEPQLPLEATERVEHPEGTELCEHGNPLAVECAECDAEVEAGEAEPAVDP
jgi:hypothetical protein